MSLATAARKAADERPRRRCRVLHPGRIGTITQRRHESSSPRVSDIAVRNAIRVDILHSVITPINYFLVLTSVIVHGITIPIGKGFSLARSRTLEITRSQTGLTGVDRVSRLPAPLPFGSDALRRQAEVDLSSEAGPTPDLGAAIRFDLDDTNEGRTRGGNGKVKGILSNPGTPSRASSRSSTPPPRQENRPSSPATRTNDRETPEMRRRGESWIEGSQVVMETDDGEKVKVVPMEQYGD